MTRPFHRLPTLVATLVLFGLGLAVGVGLLTVLGATSGPAKAFAADLTAFKSSPGVALAWSFGAVLLPALWGFMLERGEPQRVVPK